MNPFGEYAALRRFTRNLHQSQFFYSVRCGTRYCVLFSGLHVYRPRNSVNAGQGWGASGRRLSRAKPIAAAVILNDFSNLCG
jgi:hypothetical protein